MAQIVFYFIIGIIVFEFVFERILEFLNFKSLTSVLPSELHDVSNQEKYEKAILYQKEYSRFDFFSSSFNFVLIMLMFFFGGFAWIDSFVRQFSDNEIIIALLFFGTIMIALKIVDIPLSYYATYKIEEKYNLNNTTLTTFFSDIIKGVLLTVIIGGAVLWLIVWFYLNTQQFFWLYAWVFVSAFSLFMAMFYSTLIVPLFNKQTPLEDGELKDAILLFCKKVDFELDNVFIIDGSKRSSKGNAYFTGLGSKKRIVLYDTLIQSLTTDEIVAVLAHEIGHYKRKHVISSIITGIIQTGLIFYILSIFISQTVLSEALGAGQHSFHLALITFSILFSPISTIINLALNYFSRKNEYEADLFATQHFNGEHLINALKKLSMQNLSNFTPHRFYVFVNYSHPTLLQRIEYIRKNK